MDCPGRKKFILFPAQQLISGLIAIDKGPGIADADEAVGDHFSSIGALGYGLGTVHRLMDEFDMISGAEKESGLHITCRRWKPISIILKAS